MRRGVVLVLALLWAAMGHAQAPRLTAELAAEETVIGQPVTLRLTVMVPTYMPDPPIWPELAPPGVILRLPERGSTPKTERIDGQTWSGITRAYRLYPTRAGVLDLGALAVTVTWADPDSNDKRVDTVTLETPVSITVTVPDGARDLDPLIVGSGFEVEQSLTPPDPLAIGQSVTRSLTATLTGSPAVMIPPLMPSTDGANTLRAYPSEPTVSETEDRGRLTATRREEVTYLLAAPGTATLPDLSVAWFNIDSGQIEEITLPGLTIEVPAPPPPPPSPRDLLMWALGALASGLLGWWLWQQLRNRLTRIMHAYRAGEAYAYRDLRRTLARRDLAALYPALDRWWMRAGSGAPLPDAVQAALSSAGRARYGTNSASADWQQITHAIAQARSKKPNRCTGLPPLNF